MSQVESQAKFCRAGNLKRGMRILVTSASRFYTIRKVEFIQDRSRVLVQAAGFNLILEVDKDVHILDS